MRVLLINPPAKGTVQGNNPSFIDRERGCNPPLGLLYLAAALDRTRHQVRVLDCQAEYLKYRELAEEVRTFAPDVAGIHTMTLTLPDVLRTAVTVKEACPSVPVVLGGPHTIFYQDETLTHSSFDILVRGEGEKTFTELLNRLEAGDGTMSKADLSSVPGLSYKKSGSVVKTPDRDLQTNLDSIPFPAREMTPVENYYSVLARTRPITTMITSRGCPYKCTFCSRPHLGKQFRARSAVNVVDEMEVCRKMGIREFFIYDDTFTVNADRVAAICGEIRRRNLEIIFDIRARVDTVSAPLLKELKEAGCDRIHYGVEAGNDRLMEVIGKAITVKQAEEAFRLTRKAGISTLAYFMVGLPGQTRADLDDTWNLIKRLHPDFLHLTLLAPFPGSKVYTDGMQRGIFDDFWREFVLDPRPGYRIPCWEEHLTPENLNDFMEKAYRKFYLHPGRVLRQVLSLRSLKQFTAKARAGFHMLIHPH